MAAGMFVLRRIGSYLYPIHGFSLLLSVLLGSAFADAAPGPRVGADVAGALAFGPAPVIVSFDVPDAAPPSSEEFDLASWNAAVQATAQKIVADLGGVAEVRRIFQSINAVSFDLTTPGLARLVDNPRVKFIDTMPDVHPAMTQTRPLIRADVLNSMGLTGAGVHVAVIDTGIDTDHPDLVSSIIDQHCFCRDDGGCPNGAPEQAGPGSAEDHDFHGTLMSGIITGDGTQAPAGAAPDAGIVAIKVYCPNSGATDDLLAGFDWVLNTRPDIKVVTISLVAGDYPAGDCDHDDATTEAFATVIDALASRGVATFAAAGNGASTTMWSAPACVATAISVGATYDADIGPQTLFDNCVDTKTAADQIACFSNTNPALDILAPGAAITSTRITGGATTGLGTSYATPVAAACAAILFQDNPNLSVRDLVTALRTSGVPILDPRTGITYPRLDCLEAWNQVHLGRGRCPASPRTGCDHPVVAKAGTFYFKKSSTGLSDSLRWYWKKGVVNGSALGNPLQTASFSLCAYQSLPPRLQLNLFLPAGGLCAGKPCWKASAFTPGAFTYKDRLLSPSGIYKATLTPGSVGVIKITGKRANLQPPALPLTLPVTTQLINHATNHCWEVRIDDPNTNTPYPWGGIFNGRGN